MSITTAIVLVCCGARCSQSDARPKQGHGGCVPSINRPARYSTNVPQIASSANIPSSSPGFKAIRVATKNSKLPAKSKTCLLLRNVSTGSETARTGTFERALISFSEDTTQSINDAASMRERMKVGASERKFNVVFRSCSMSLDNILKIHVNLRRYVLPSQYKRCYVSWSNHVMIFS